MKTTIPRIATLVFLVTTPGLASDHVWPLPEWTKAKPSDVGMDESQLQKARDHLLQLALWPDQYGDDSIKLSEAFGSVARAGLRQMTPVMG